MEIKCELKQILINERSSEQRVVISEKGGDRRFPIIIGIPEALAFATKTFNEWVVKIQQQIPH